jgi:hypothetical protein
MNCKPGDLAIVVDSDANNEGKIVRCVRLSADNSVYSLVTRRWEYGPVWEIEPHLTNVFGRLCDYCADNQLRPIRPQDDHATDETLLWLPVPSQTEETA